MVVIHAKAVQSKTKTIARTPSLLWSALQIYNQHTVMVLLCAYCANIFAIDEIITFSHE